MAKKTVASLQSGAKNFTKCIKMVKTANGSYSFNDEIIHNDKVADFFKK